MLQSVSLELPAGRSCLIGGRNGSGKTTLLRILAGLMARDAGAVSVEGLDVERDRLAYQRRIGFVSAGDAGLPGRLTVARHLALWARMSFVPRARRAASVRRAIEAFALGDLLHRRIDRLSSGQRQRVRLASAWVPRPAVLLLDEPRTSLDEEGDEWLRQALAAHAGDGGSTVWCSPHHEPGFAFDQRMRLESGTLRA